MSLYVKIFKEVCFYLMDFYYVYVVGKYPIRYFDKVDNVGDLISPYLVRHIVGKEIYNVKSASIKHILGLGSMFHMASNCSIIWGTGIISDSIEFYDRTSFHKILAVRGKLTRDLLLRNNNIFGSDIVLGDPGLLMPVFYHPVVKKKNKIGIIPHYVDAENSLLSINKNFCVLDVSLDPESFVDLLLSCDFILSSSLHGLILSDAYGIPNKWIVLSKNITGGDFKYRDYYSTTSQKDESFVLVDSEEALDGLIDDIVNISSVKEFVYDLDSLLNVFPK